MFREVIYVRVEKQIFDWIKKFLPQFEEDFLNVH